MAKTAYLSGPMSGIKDFNYPAFHANAAFLRNSGWDVLSPAELDADLGINADMVMTEEIYLDIIKHDYAALIKSDAIAFMPGWEKSRGAKLESDFANVLKLDRYRVDADKNYLEKESIIGFCGYATVGKDRIAQEFVEKGGFERVGFADALRSILYALNPKVELFNNDYIGHWHIKNIVDDKGWDEAKKEPEIRQLLQRLGTEGGRAALGEDIWVKALFSSPHGARVVIPDVRFQNEADEIRRRGGIVVQIMRPGVGPVNSHASDKIDFEADYFLMNDKTPEEAYDTLASYMESPL